MHPPSPIGFRPAGSIASDWTRLSKLEVFWVDANAAMSGPLPAKLPLSIKDIDFHQDNPRTFGFEGGMGGG